MHQALIGAGGERMRPVRRHRALRRHAGVPDAVAASHPLQAERRRDIGRPADLLEQGHPRARADHRDLRRQARGDRRRFLVWHERHPVRAMRRDPDTIAEVVGERLPIVAVGRPQGEAHAARLRRAVDGEPGAVGTAIAQGFRHGGEHRAELGRERRILQIEPDDPAHACALAAVARRWRKRRREVNIRGEETFPVINPSRDITAGDR